MMRMLLQPAGWASRRRQRQRQHCVVELALQLPEAAAADSRMVIAAPRQCAEVLRVSTCSGKSRPRWRLGLVEAAVRELRAFGVLQFKIEIGRAHV